MGSVWLPAVGLCPVLCMLGSTFDLSEMPTGNSAVSVYLRARQRAGIRRLHHVGVRTSEDSTSADGGSVLLVRHICRRPGHFLRQCRATP